MLPNCHYTLLLSFQLSLYPLLESECYQLNIHDEHTSYLLQNRVRNKNEDHHNRCVGEGSYATIHNMSFTLVMCTIEGSWAIIRLEADLAFIGSRDTTIVSPATNDGHSLNISYVQPVGLAAHRFSL